MTIDGFKVTSNEGDGIIIETSRHTIKNNYIVSNKANGIDFGVDTHGTTVKNNYIALNGASGIDSGKRAYDITIENNHITLNELNGILLKSKNHDIRIEKNTITLNVGRGIWLFEWGNNNPIHHNNIYGNTGVIPDGNTDYGGIEACWPGKTEVEFTEVDATNNWWGATNGPSGFGPGDGDAVSDYVDFANWLESPYEESAGAVSMTTASEEAVIGISVSPSTIDFGAITSGVTRGGPSLTVANIGNVPVAVDAEIIADTFFDDASTKYFYTAALKLNEVLCSGVLSDLGGTWAATILGLDSIAVGQSGSVSTKVVCPSPIKAATTYTGTVVFWAEQPERPE
ncbi:hypothetical protein ES708_01962 [subsurface metagenome]